MYVETLSIQQFRCWQQGRNWQLNGLNRGRSRLHHEGSQWSRKGLLCHSSLWVPLSVPCGSSSDSRHTNHHKSLSTDVGLKVDLKSARLKSHWVFRMSTSRCTAQDTAWGFDQKRNPQNGKPYQADQHLSTVGCWGLESICKENQIISDTVYNIIFFSCIPEERFWFYTFWSIGLNLRSKQKTLTGRCFARTLFFAQVFVLANMSPSNIVNTTTLRHWSSSSWCCRHHLSSKRRLRRPRRQHQQKQENKKHTQ